jgi:type II secretion system protein J
LRHLLALEHGLDEHARAHARLRLAVVLLERDLAAAATRGVRDAQGDVEPALRAGVDGELLTLTRHATVVPSGAADPGLRRVRYRLQDGVLIRDVWEQLDRTPATRYSTRRILNGVRALRIRFFVDGAWRDFWPADDAATAVDSLPNGIEFVLELEGAHSTRRVLARAG